MDCLGGQLCWPSGFLATWLSRPISIIVLLCYCCHCLSQIINIFFCFSLSTCVVSLLCDVQSTSSDGVTQNATGLLPVSPVTIRTPVTASTEILQSHTWIIALVCVLVGVFIIVIIVIVVSFVLRRRRLVSKTIFSRFSFGCLGGCIGWALDSWSKGHWFDSRPGCYQVN